MTGSSRIALVPCCPTKPASGAAPLHAAAHAGQVAALQLLLAAGADINASDGHGATALDVSRRYDQSDAEGVLLRAGAVDPDANKWPGARRIDLAAADGQKAAAGEAAADGQAAAAGETAAQSEAKAEAQPGAQLAAQPMTTQPVAPAAAPPAAAAAEPEVHPPPVAVHAAAAAAEGKEGEEGEDTSGSVTEEEEEVMTSTAAAAEEAVVAFSNALAAAEAAEAAAEAAEGMPGPEAAQRAAAFRKEAEAAIVAAAAAAVMAGDSLDAVLPPRDGSPDKGGLIPAGWAQDCGSSEQGCLDGGLPLGCTTGRFLGPGLPIIAARHSTVCCAAGVQHTVCAISCALQSLAHPPAAPRWPSHIHPPAPPPAPCPAEPEGDSLAPLPPADSDRLGPLPTVPHLAVASSSVASVCGSDGPAMSLDTAEFTSLASQGEVGSQADAASQAGATSELASQAEVASVDDAASAASAGGLGQLLLQAGSGGKELSALWEMLCLHAAMLVWSNLRPPCKGVCFAATCLCAVSF